MVLHFTIVFTHNLIEFFYLTDNGKVVKGIIWSRSITSPYSGEAYVINNEILFVVDGFDIIVNSLANEGLAVFSHAYQKVSYPTGINSSISTLLISVISIIYNASFNRS